MANDTDLMGDVRKIAQEVKADLRRKTRRISAQRRELNALRAKAAGLEIAFNDMMASNSKKQDALIAATIGLANTTALLVKARFALPQDPQSATESINVAYTKALDSLTKVVASDPANVLTLLAQKMILP